MSEGANRIAVVVGGGAGIGQATALTLSRHGWRVAVADINRSNAEATVRECSGGVAFEIDINDANSIEACAEAIDREFGPVYGAVACAATFQERRPLEQTPVADFDRVIQSNLRGTYLVDTAFGKRMAARGAGAIVNISSWNGFDSSPVHGYCASKAGVNLLTEGMAAEWGRSNVRVNCVTPGFVKVPRIAERMRTGGRYSMPLGDLAALGRVVEPEEVAETIAFLLSDRASAVTGANLAVDAGIMASHGWRVFGGPSPPRQRTPEN